jgi:mediator of RNA polymerase II transcription subunit 17
MSADPLLLSLRSWPEDDAESQSLASLISRIQAQRGHFRDVDETILEAEIAGEKERAALGDDGDIEMEESSGQAAAPEEVDRVTELKNAKAEISALIGYACSLLRSCLF